MITWEAGFPCVPYPELQFPKSDIFDARVNAPIYAAFSDLEHLWTSAGLCVFGFWPPTLPLVEAISAVTGYDLSLSQGLAAGRRIQTLRQAFNIREGVKTSEWRLPDRLEAVPSTGPTEGIKVDYKMMKENGYAALGWEASTGRPLDSTLEQLGIKELVGKLS
jgi:aldehyde:ferredoxin oxidoreductase